MPTRYLSTEQRKSFGRFAARLTQVTKYFTLASLRVIRHLRSPSASGTLFF